MRGVRECPTLTLGGTGPHSTLVRAATRHRSIPAANISVGNAVRVPAYHLSSSVWQEVLKTAEHRQGIIPLLVLHNCKECHTTSVYPTESPEVWVRGGVVFFFCLFSLQSGLPWFSLLQVRLSAVIGLPLMII